MGVAAEAKRTEAKDPPILQLDKKEHSPPLTNLPELFPPRSPLKVFHAAAAFPHRGLKGATREVRGSSGPWWGREPRTWCQTPVELGTS